MVRRMPLPYPSFAYWSRLEQVQWWRVLIRRGSWRVSSLIYDGTFMKPWPLAIGDQLLLFTTFKYVCYCTVARTGTLILVHKWYIPGKWLHIVYNCRITVECGGCLNCRVADTGLGDCSSQLQNARAKPETGRQDGLGTGIGQQQWQNSDEMHQQATAKNRDSALNRYFPLFSVFWWDWDFADLRFDEICSSWPIRMVLLNRDTVWCVRS